MIMSSPGHRLASMIAARRVQTPAGTLTQLPSLGTASGSSRVLLTLKVFPAACAGWLPIHGMSSATSATITSIRSRLLRGWMDTMVCIGVVSLIIKVPSIIRNPADIRPDGRRRGVRLRFAPRHADQDQPQVARLAQQAVKRGMVGDQALQCSVTRGVVSDRQPIEPGRPMRGELPFDADLVVCCHGHLLVVAGGVPFVHGWPA